MDEVATVIVQVRSITSRPVRKRGMKPLVTAVVADATGTMEATFFNQPWLQRKYAPGTRLLLSGKYQARNRFRVQFHAETGEEVGAASDEMATYPATDGLSTTQILALARQWRGAAQETMEPLPARLRAIERLPGPRRGARRGALRRPRGRPPPARLRGAAAGADRAAAPARAAPRGRARRAAGAAGRARALVARGLAAVRADRRPARRDGHDRRRPRGRAADAAAADGRGRLRQDRRRALRDAARGRVGRPGGADGADRDARRAALRDAAGADAGRARPGGAADGLHARRAPHRPARQAAAPAS